MILPVSGLTVSGAFKGDLIAASLAKTMASGGKHYYEALEATGGWIGITGEGPTNAGIDVSGSIGDKEAIAVSDDTSHTKHLVSGNLYDGATTVNGVTWS